MRNLDKRVSNTYYTPNTGSLNHYLNDISKFKVLPDEEIRELLKKAKNGNKKAFDEIINCNQRFVFSLSKRFCNGNYDLLSDLINEANIGLIKSIEKFDFDNKNKFLSYAVYWMQRQIFMYLTFMEPIIKTSNKAKTVKVGEIKNKFLLINGRQPTTDEIIEELFTKYGIEISNESDVYQMSTTSIDNEMINETYDDFSSFYTKDSENFEIASTQNKYEENVEDDYFKSVLKTSINVLTDKEATIIKLLYGIDDYREYEIQEVAEKLSMSKEGVRLINKRALEKLRNEITIKRFSV